MGSAKESNGAGVKSGSNVHKRKGDDDVHRHDDRRKIRAVDEKFDRQERSEKGRGERDRGGERERLKDVERERDKSEKTRGKGDRDEKEKFERDQKERDREKREKERTFRDKDRDLEKDKERSFRDKGRDAEKERDKDKDRSHGKGGSHSRSRDHDRHLPEKERERDNARVRELDTRAVEREKEHRDKEPDKDPGYPREVMKKQELDAIEAEPGFDEYLRTNFTSQMSGVQEAGDSSGQDNGKTIRIEDAPMDKNGNASQTSKGSSLTTPSAVAKAKRALEMQKLLSEKIKKLPQVSRLATQSSTTAASVTAPMASSSAVSSAVPPLPTGSGVGISSTGISSTESVPTNANLVGTGFNFLPNMVPNFPGFVPGVQPVSNYEAFKRVQEVAARLGIHQVPGSLPLLAMLPGQVTDDFGTHQKGVKGPVLRLDAQGREIDEHGNVLEKTKISTLSTLKVNINKQKKESFQILHPELEEDPVNSPFFDLSMGIDKKKLLRSKRPSFQFVEEGRWSKQAEIMRLKSQFGEAQAKEMKLKQAAFAKAKAEADINPNLIEVSERVPMKEEKPRDPIPDVEWWDAVLLPSGSYRDVNEGDLKVKMEKLTIYVEHPVPIEPPAEPAPPPPQPLKLTRKERKKLRTQRRLAKEKDRQEMIRQGLLDPPKPKVKMSNLMKVLGAEATQDPTKLEMEIRTAAAEREQAHTDRNLARKLTPAERRDKKERKLFDDPNTLETLVSVFRVNDLSHPQTRFKVDINAQQNRLTGCIVMCDTMSIVVVEGGSKSMKRFKKLMLDRIKWATAVKEDEEADNGDAPRVNRCVLVWQGSVAKPSYERFLIQQCRTEAAARKYLADSGVGHYWDLAANFVEE